MRILIIEDDRQTSDYIAKGFTEAGHIAEVISDGRSALSHAAGTEYDILIVDRMLPGLDGQKSTLTSGTRLSAPYVSCLVTSIVRVPSGR